ncbi:DUF7144 family membrane protein [Streptomyces sp. BH105]|uniref:DUF7144 family membrane protein n=1 Tax=Streptomyces sp. BH105 TaxID=3410408 RepID=UPI003CE8DBAB
MTEQMSPGPARSDPSGASQPPPRVNLGVVGGVVFAAIVMGLIGGYHAIAGLSAVLNDNYYQAQHDYAFDFDTNARGWVQMITGVIVFAAAVSLFSGRTWARIVVMTIAAMSALENFFFTPYQPVWSAILIALDILVIWSLAMYGHREAHKVYGAPL